MNDWRELPQMLFRAFRNSPIRGSIISGLILLSLPVFLYILPLWSRDAGNRLRRMRDEYISKSLANLECALDMRCIMRLYLQAFVLYIAFWMFFGLFLYFGFGAYAVLAIPGHVITFVATRPLMTVWADLDLRRSRFHLLYTALNIIALIPGMVLYVIRFVN